MDKGTVIQAIDVLLKFHKEKLKRGYNDSIKIIFYGGEPLLNVEGIFNLSQQLSLMKDIQIKYQIITNGYLLNKKISNDCLYSRICCIKLQLMELKKLIIHDVRIKQIMIHIKQKFKI